MMDREVEAYLRSVPKERLEHLKALHDLIVKLFPEATVDMKYKMPTYQFGEGWVAIANQKSYVSLYTCGYAHIAKFKENHPNYKTGKGCINFKESDTLPIQDLKRVIQHAILHPKDSEPFQSR
jgi:uncharacterized protein YdhG (YjbR/CyaY superfamily)